MLGAREVASRSRTWGGPELGYQTLKRTIAAKKEEAVF